MGRVIIAGLRVSGFSNATIFELGEDGVTPCPGTPLPKGRTAFQHFFAPLWPYLNGEYLLAGHGQSPFTSGMVLETSSTDMEDAEYARWVVDLAIDRGAEGEPQQFSDLMLFRPGVVAAWGHSVKDDWCSIIALGTDADHAKRVASELIQLEIDHYRFARVAAPHEENEVSFRETVLREARAVFTCLDGRAWEMYAEDPPLLDTVAEHVLSAGAFRVDRLAAGDCLRNDW